MALCFLFTFPPCLTAISFQQKSYSSACCASSAVRPLLTHFPQHPFHLSTQTTRHAFNSFCGRSAAGKFHCGWLFGLVPSCIAVVSLGLVHWRSNLTLTFIYTVLQVLCLSSFALSASADFEAGKQPLRSPVRMVLLSLLQCIQQSACI